MEEKTGDRESCTTHFNRVYDETFEKAKRYIALKCSDPLYIQDILQDVYLDYFKLISKHGTDYADDELAVIMKIAKRRIYRYYSFKSSISSLIPLFKTNEEGNELCVVDTEVYDSSGDDVITELEAERIWGIINTYPAETRRILYLYFNEDMSHSEIAEALGRKISYVKNRIYRTLSEIREKENGYEREKNQKSIQQA